MNFSRLSNFLPFLLVVLFTSFTFSAPSEKFSASLVEKINLLPKLLKTTYETVNPDSIHFQDYHRQLLYFAEALDRFEINALMLYQLVDDFTTKLLCEFIPENMSNPNERKTEHRFLTHFAQSFDPVMSCTEKDFRHAAMSRVDYLHRELAMRQVYERYSASVITFGKFLLDLQVMCLEEINSFDDYFDEHFDVLDHLEHASVFIDCYVQSGDILLHAVHQVRDEYFDDLVKLGETNLEYRFPEDISEKAIFLIARTHMMDLNYPIAHHEVCQQARFIQFRNSPEGINAGKYREMKKEREIPTTGMTFMDLFDELEFSLENCKEFSMEITDWIKKYWNAVETSAHKKAMVTLYVGNTWADTIINEVYGTVSSGRQLNSQDRIVIIKTINQACGVHFTTLQALTVDFLPPIINQLTARMMSLTRQVTGSYHDHLLNLNELYEANFATVRSSCPAVFDMAFLTNELTMILSMICSLEAADLNTCITMDNIALCSIGNELFNFAHYVFPVLDKLEMAGNFNLVTDLLDKGIKDIRAVFDTSLVPADASAAVLSYFMEASAWRSSLAWPQIQKQIPRQYVNSVSRRNGFSIESILRRIKDPEQEIQEVRKDKLDDKSAEYPEEKNDEKKKPKHKTSKKAQKRRRLREKEKKNKYRAASKFEDQEDASDTRDSSSEERSEDSPTIMEKKNPAMLWNNAAGNLFVDVSHFQGKPQPGPIVEEPDQPTALPTHYTAIIELLGYGHVEADPRDLAMGLVLVGQRIWKRHLRPLLDAFDANSLDYLKDLFMQSLDNFEQEMALMSTHDPELIAKLFKESSILDMAYFKRCLKFYRQRMTITHPHIPRQPALRAGILQKHLTTLEFSGRISQKAINKWRDELKCHEQIVVEGIQEDGRPANVLSVEYTQRALSFVAIHEALPFEFTVVERNSYAHRNVDNLTFEAYLNYLFSADPDIQFLQNLA